jgi:hypothetical protein
MASKAYFNVEESLKLSPPQKSPGVKFIKRIVVKRDKITYPDAEQTRVHAVKQPNVIDIRNSFEVNGWIHTERPPFGYVDPDNSDRFIGISGFNRNAAASQLGWDTIIFDVYEFESPLAKRIAKTKANQHRKPFSPNTKSDLVKQVIDAIKAKEINPDEKSIKDLIEEIAEDKILKERKKIFDSVIKQKGGSDTIRTYHTSKGDYSTEEAALKLQLPYSGDEHFKTFGKLGYIHSMKTPKTTLYDAKSLSNSYGGAKVSFIAFIEDPKEQPKIYEQRKNHKEAFDQFLRKDAEFVLNIVKSYGINTTVDDILKKYPIVFQGFLPQVITPDVTKGGKPKEETLVDELGREVVIR